MPRRIAERQHSALERVGRLVQQRARAELGTYQPAVGPLPAWDPLAETTLMGVAVNGVWHPGKIDLGFASPGEDNPLQRTGAMGETIDFHVDGHHSVEIGSDDDRVLWAELGTVNEPARSILERAGITCTPRVLEIARRAMLEAVVPYGVLRAPEGD